MKKVIIIGSKLSTKNDPDIIASHLRNKQCLATVVYWEDMCLFIDKRDIRITFNSVDIVSEQPDIVLLLGWYRSHPTIPYRDMAYAASLIFEENNIRYWNQEAYSQRSTTKLSCMVQLAQHQIPVPQTFFSLDTEKLMEVNHPPFVIKAVAASRGKYNFLISSENELSQLQNKIKQASITQEFIPNDYDLRIICMNSKPKLILKRSRSKDSRSHLNNTSMGGHAEWVDFESVPIQLLTLSKKICKIMKRNIAGIDFIPDDSSPCGFSCLEVNAVPQLTSGFDRDIKMNILQNVILERL